MTKAAAAPQRRRLALVAYGLAVLVIIVDQLSKLWILNGLKLGERGSIRVLPIFDLTLVWNQGVSFGLFREHGDVGRWVLTGFAAAVVVVIAWWARRADRPVLAAALGLILGGAAGNNLIDRVRLGAVVDFLDFKNLGFPWVFNVADSAITIGVVLLLLDSFARPAREPDQA